MSFIPDGALRHLQEVADFPDLTGTPYALVDELGRGGMGRVYRAIDSRLGREVALKILSLPDPSPEDSGRLLREATIIARLEHPGIVPVHDAGVLPDGRVFYAMKLVRGLRLDEARLGDRPVSERLRLFARLCDAVAFAHAHGVIHRDLKPENVMLGPFGETLVMDWGVAKIAGGGEIAGTSAPAGGEAAAARAGTSEGVIVGTPEYMAPEQARGENDRVDARSDVFALGGILHYLLTGGSPSRAPFRARPRRLEAIRRKALAADPAERYANAGDLAADIGRYMDGLPVVAHRDSALERALLFASRNRTALGLVAAYLVMRILFILFRRK